MAQKIKLKSLKQDTYIQQGAYKVHKAKNENHIHMHIKRTYKFKGKNLVASNVVRQLINLALFYMKVYWQFLREYDRAIFTLHNNYAPR